MAAALPHGTLDAAAREYLGAVAERLRATLGRDLLGAYLVGSAAVGDYRPRHSDLDVAAVVKDRVREEALRAAAAAVRHDVLPCPARGLELVVYRRSAMPRFALNVNTGPGMEE